MKVIVNVEAHLTRRVGIFFKALAAFFVQFSIPPLVLVQPWNILCETLKPYQLRLK